MNLEEKVEELRKEKLEKNKVQEISLLMDKKDALEVYYKKELDKISKKIEEIKELEFLPVIEGENIFYKN